MAQVVLPENIDHDVLFALLIILGIMLSAALLWQFGIRRYLKSRIEPTNGRHDEAEKRGVHSIGDLMYDQYEDVRDIRQSIRDVHRDLRNGFDKNESDHMSLKNSHFEERMERKADIRQVQNRLDEHDRRFTEVGLTIDEIERHLALGEGDPRPD